MRPKPLKRLNTFSKSDFSLCCIHTLRAHQHALISFAHLLKCVFNCAMGKTSSNTVLSSGLHTGGALPFEGDWCCYKGGHKVNVFRHCLYCQVKVRVKVTIFSFFQ